MKGVSKLEAVRLFQEFNLEGLPAVIYDYGTRPDRTVVARDFPALNVFMLRTGSRSEERNLPRQAGVLLNDVENWINALPSHLDVVVQPYSPVIYSVELAWYDNGYLAELVPGIWELNTAISPLVLCENNDQLIVRGSLEPQMAAYHTLEQGYYRREACIQDWAIQAFVSWTKEKRERLSDLRTRLGIEVLGLKLHSALGYGLSPQNIRTNVPVCEESQSMVDISRLARVASINDTFPGNTEVFLDVSIARENHAELTALIDRLVAANIQVVYLKSGILSHLAITLREAGLAVRRM